MKLFTIGFSQKTAEEFFELLESAGVMRVIDVRLHNISQLAGWTKYPDFPYLLRRVAGIAYLHLPELLAPTEEIFQHYRREKGSWDELEASFGELLAERPLRALLSRKPDLQANEAEAERPMLADGDCLVCSEPTPAKCHRRLVAEHLHSIDGSIEVIHL